MFKFPVSNHYMGIIAILNILQLLPLMACVWWMFWNRSEFSVQILICVWCLSGTAAGGTGLFGLTQLHHEVCWASVCPHHSRMEKTVHKLWGRTFKCAKPVCDCTKVLCLLLHTILYNLNCTIYSYWITWYTGRVKYSSRFQEKLCSLWYLSYTSLYFTFWWLYI
jgi:hypothetical protein